MKSMTPEARNRTTAALLAVLLLAGPLASLVPAAEAAPAAGTVLINVTETTAGREQENTQRQVTVTNNDNGGRAVSAVIFRVDTQGGTPPKSIDWVGSLSQGPPGWTHVVDNTESPREIKFVQNTGGAISPGGSAVFTVGFSVKGAPAHGDVFPVKVRADFTPFVTPVDVIYNIVIDDAAPSVLPTGVITLDLKDGSQDDANGKLDHVLVVFDEPIDRKTLSVKDLRLAGYVITNFQWTGIIPANTSITAGGNTFGKCPISSTRGCEQLLLSVAEGFEYDTGRLPQFTTRGTPLRDVAGNALALIGDATITEVDGAHPVLVAAVAKDLEGSATELEGMRVTFSEKVRGSGAPGNSLAVVTLDFTYVELNFPGCSLSPNCDQGNPQDHNGVPGSWVVTHPPGDAAPSDTNLVEVQFSPNGVAKPLLKRDVGNDGDQLACNDSIRDLSSSGVGGKGLPCKNPPSDFRPDGALPIFIPAINKAEVNIDSRKITVEFNVPVSDASGDNVRVQAESFDIVPTDGGGPQGIIKVTQDTPCTDRVIIELDQPTKPTDVDNSPSYLRVVDGAIKGCGTGAANPLFVIGGDTRLQDLTAPAVISASTIDENGNGIIDGFFLEFSEPIDDASYCFGANPCAHTTYGSDLVRFPQEATPLPNDKARMISLADRAGIIDLSTIRWFTYDTDRAANDRFGIIKWTEPAAPHLDTAFVPELFIEEGGLFVDLSVSGSVSGTGKLKPTTLDADAPLNELDGAAPVILTAHTLDRETRLRGQPSGSNAAGCIINLNRLCEEDPDGLIDGYRVVFSEPVRDDTFDKDQWRVEGRTITGKTADIFDGDLLDDRTLIISFRESDGSTGPDGRPLPDTDHKPQLTYTKGTFTDLVGNIMESVTESKLNEQDGARPVIYHVEGFVNQKELRIFFSEPVDNAVGEKLIRSDFVYSNGNSPRDGMTRDEILALEDGTTGFDNNIPVQHKPGDELAILTLNAPLTAKDLEADRVGANQLSIRESTASVVDKQHVLTTFKSLKFAKDITAPGEVKDLRLDVVDANSVTLRWSAPPDDDGNPQSDPVAGYVLKIATDTFDFFNDTEPFVTPDEKKAIADALARDEAPKFCLAANRDLKNIFLNGGSTDCTLNITYTPASPAAPGQVQKVKITGLNPETSYFFTVRAYDNDVNATDVPFIGGWNKTLLEVETLEDPTPPTGVLNLRSTTHPANRPVLVSQASFQWDALTDPESTVIYHYALDSDPATQVTRDHAQTTATSVTVPVKGLGTWYFHIRGFSGGGEQSATTTYKIIYGHTSVEKVLISEYNQLARSSMKVVRDDDANVISWNLPPSADVGELEAVRVWRLDEGRYQLLTTVSGTYDQLKQQSYRDESEGATPDAYYVIDTVFSAGQDDGDPSLAKLRPVQVESTPKDGVPPWIWVAIAGAGLLIIGGILAIVIVRARHVPPTSYLDEEVGLDDETGLPSHRVTCPTCSHGFQAVGHTPLEITCPSCNTTGVLE